jgi:peptidoglycan L-alanyl-D-glutamate endopeptidase CwlK
MASDQITLDRIQTLHPKVRQEVQDMYMHANNKILGKGVRLRFSHTLRTFAEQDSLYAQGRTKSGSIVTNAKGGQSFHNFGLAFDIVLLYDKDNNGTFETASWDNQDPNWIKVTNYFKSQGWSWGGDFKSFKDYPHFEKTFGYTTKQLNDLLKLGYPEI